MKQADSTGGPKMTQSHTNDQFEYILVGGGPATRILNHYLHIFDPEVDVAVIRKEDSTTNKCSIPYIIDGTVPLQKKAGISDDKIVTRFGSRLIKEKVVSGDTAEKHVVTDAGNQYGYEKLVLATGSTAAVPPIPGTELEGVLKVRHIEDLRRTLRAVADNDSLVVLGAGYIGLEVSAALRRLDKHVTVVELLPHVMGNRYDPELVSQVETTLREHGIDLHLGTPATALVGNGKVEYVELEDGTRLQTDAVILATGVKPQVEYASELGLETTRDGIVVDEFFQTNVPDVYALGDCIETRSHVTGKPFPGKLGSNAAQMARTLGMSLNGHSIPFEGVINPACTKIFDIYFCSAGHTEKDARDDRIDIHVSKTQNTDIYGNMPDKEAVSVKLIFRKADRCIIGGEIVGKTSRAGFVDCLGQLIYRGATVEDIVTMDFSVHPEMTPNPAHSYLMFAAQKWLQQRTEQSD